MDKRFKYNKLGKECTLEKVIGFCKDNFNENFVINF